MTLDKDAQGAADRFMEKLTSKGFTISRSKNSGKTYSAARQKGDSDAVAEFTKTKIFKDIMNLK